MHTSHIYVLIHTHICIHACTDRLYTYLNVNIHMAYINKHTCIIYIYACTYTCPCTSAYLHVYIYTYVHTHGYM